MKRLTLLGLVLLCTQQHCWGVPIGSTLKEEQLLYSYSGGSDTGSSACSDRFGSWSVTGNLTVQLLENSLVLQLQNLKTTLYNGFREDYQHFDYFEDIPNEAKVLEEPFVLNSDFSLSLAPNEPLWAVNFKRGIASNFHEVIEGTNQEKSVFGNCQTNTESKDGAMVKTINHSECDDVHFKRLTNVRRAPSHQNFNPINRKTVYYVTFASGKAFPPENIISASVLNYTSMPKVPYTQQILQRSELNLISSSSEFDHIDTSKLTEKKDIFFEYAEEITQGRHKPQTDIQVLTDRFLKEYNNFETFFQTFPLKNRRNSTDDPVENMYDALYDMPNEKGFNDLREKILSKNDDIMYRTFLSLLSYVGTEHAVKVINEIISGSEIERHQYSGLKLLSTFPHFIKDVTEELVQSLEGMLEAENNQIDTIKTAQILSFASVVERAYRQKHLSEAGLAKYRTIYFDKIMATENYDTQFIYLMGLMNMAEVLSPEFQLSFITNASIPIKLRSWALAGFKNTLKLTDAEKLWDTFWPMVLNNEENFDLRIEALDLLLSANLSEVQFFTIVHESKQFLTGDMRSKHLANYVVSTLESIQNKTAYREPLSDLATQTIQNKAFPVYPRAFWQTGNYRLSYSDVDSNLGGYIHARLIGVPETGAFTTIQLSYNQFAWSFDTGTYTIYLKSEGLLEASFAKAFHTAIEVDGGLDKLIKLVEKYNYKMKEMNVQGFADVIIYSGDKVVYAKSVNPENKNESIDVIENLFGEIVLNGFSLSYPLVDYTQMPSLLGTPLIITNDMQNIDLFSYIHNDFLFRSSWYFQIWLDSYNPILDTTVSSFKYYGDEKAIRARVATNFERKVFGWANKNDTFNWALDKQIGTYVDEELLHRFCPICEGVTEVPTDLNTQHKIQNLTYLGTKYNLTTEQYEDMGENREFFLTIKDVHQSNSDAIPFAQPLLLILHTFRHDYFLKPELKRTIYRTIEVKEDTLTRVNFTENIKHLTSSVDPYVDTHQNYSLTIITKNLHEPDWVEGEKIDTHWELIYEIKSTPNFTYPGGKQKTKVVTNVYLTTNSQDGGFQVCSTRLEFLPFVSANKFHILPPEDASAMTIIKHELKNNETNWKYCNSNQTITLMESYTTYEERNKQIMESSFYKQCLEESKGWKYTPPTNSCIAAYYALSRYDKYTAKLRLENIFDMDFDGLSTSPVFTYEQVDIDKLAYSAFLTPFFEQADIEAQFNNSIYFPYKPRNPIAEVNSDQDIFRGLKRTCIISPNEIKTFTANYVPTTHSNKQVALVECISAPQRSVEFEKVNNHQIDLDFTSRNHTIVGTVDAGKLKITLNGEELSDSILEENISVRFLDENAVYISDDQIGIYYNTEYILIKAKPWYKNLICGLCDE